MGVDSNDNAVNISGVPDSGFTWDDDAVNISNIAYLDNSGTNAQIISGGAFNVQLIPEPSAVMFLLTSALFMVVLNRESILILLRTISRAKFRPSACASSTSVRTSGHTIAVLSVHVDPYRVDW